MALIAINRNPSAKELRVFGLLLAVFLGVVGVILRYRFGAPRAAIAVWVAGVALPLLYFAAPPLRRPIYLGWLYLSFPIGWVVSHVLLGLMYFAVFTPIGLLLRAVGKDPMSRKFAPSASSYWSEHRPCDAGAAKYFRQY